MIRNGTARAVTLIVTDYTSFLAWGIERLSLNIALKPCPLAPGPMYKNAPLPALKELWLQDDPLATAGNVTAFLRIGSVGSEAPAMKISQAVSG